MRKTQYTMSYIMGYGNVIRIFTSDVKNYLHYFQLHYNYLPPTHNIIGTCAHAHWKFKYTRLKPFKHVCILFVFKWDGKHISLHPFCSLHK